MEILKNTYGQKPIVLYELEELYKSLLKINACSNNQFSTQIINSLITKVELIIKKFKYNPRLPLDDIEHEIIKVCKQDPLTHGVVVKLLFTKRFETIDLSRLSQITVNV